MSRVLSTSFFKAGWVGSHSQSAALFLFLFLFLSPPATLHAYAYYLLYHMCAFFFVRFVTKQTTHNSWQTADVNARFLDTSERYVRMCVCPRVIYFKQPKKATRSSLSLPSKVNRFNRQQEKVTKDQFVNIS
jgi:hypothetical protein